MKHGGQVTLFIILGIVFVILIGLLVYFQRDLFFKNELEKELSYPPEVQEVRDHIQSCLDAGAENAVIDVGLNGGYFLPPEQSFSDDETGVNVPYYYLNGTVLVPSKEIVQDELSKLTDIYVESCISFSQFSKFNISEGDRVITAEIENTSLAVNMAYTVVVAAGENVYSLDKDYETTVDASLGWLLSVAEKVVEHDTRDPESIDYTYILSLGVPEVIIAPFENDTLLYILTDTQSFNAEQNFTFMFAEWYPSLEPAPECEDDFECNDGFVCESNKCVEPK